ncbi:MULTISPECIES: PilZ domain-containing protein [unclassified Sphingomonas]|uniref:PilZ domain-containing protein n=1 Tax=unclassified Sphingomonas TaxID=196159 RepID=UPI000929D8D8|nr:MULTISPECIES: PilZ domain-containing protein [unclassified Sphingomonas]MBN8846684.1 PilZ domain-containing protein [Sphingomonas sp.]OJV34019.1 MAG: pilus assembly protein PilZ [Sphingomonas sp. 67-36]
MFAAEFEPAPSDIRRRGPRAPVSFDSSAIGAGGLARALCKVIDLSIHGARLSTYSALRKGMSIWLTLPEVGPVGAEVMWADDFAAGCRFDAPLDPAAFEQLLRREGHVAAH